MKLATLKNSTRDGELIIVNATLTQAVSAQTIAPTLQHALEHWSDTQFQLQKLSDSLNEGTAPNIINFDAKACHSPLPRAYQWVDGSAYVNHIQLVRKARGADMPDDFWHDPLMYQGGSDNFVGPTDPILVASTDYGIDFEAEIAVITDDVPMGVSHIDAAKHIKLIMLVNDVSLRSLIPNELSKGFGFFHSKPSSAFSPITLTPDELGDAWQDSMVHLPLVSTLNKIPFGTPNAGIDMTFNFSQLIEHAAKTRPLIAGTIIGSGTVSNEDRSCGSSCIVEKRMLETIAEGKALTPFMNFGDDIKIEMFDKKNKSLFGAIHQTVKQYIPKLFSNAGFELR